MRFLRVGFDRISKASNNHINGAILINASGESFYSYGKFVESSTATAAKIIT